MTLTTTRRTALAATALTVAAPRAWAQAPIVIKFSHVVAADTPKGKAAEYFKKRAEERTKGKVKVEIYPNSQLYKDKEEMEALQLGAVQMLAPSLAKFGPLGVTEFEVFDLPYHVRQLRRAAQGDRGSPSAKEMLKKLEPKGISGLAYWDNGFKIDQRQQADSKRRRTCKGLKMRIQSLQGARGADARAEARTRR